MALLLFGHRGAAGEAPENTMLGFKHAYETAGVRCFELDVHLTLDGKLAVIHDSTLERTTNGTGQVTAYSMPHLQELDAGKLFPSIKGKATIPTLDEVLNAYAKNIAEFQIEIKTDAKPVLDEVARLVLEAISRHGIKDKTVVTSFDTYAITAIRSLDGTQRCGLIAMEYTERDLMKAIELGCRNTCIRTTTVEGKRLVARARAAGLQTTGWLGNSTADVDLLLSWGVDSITTNYPGTIRRYLENSLGLKII